MKDEQLDLHLLECRKSNQKKLISFMKGPKFGRRTHCQNSRYSSQLNDIKFIYSINYTLKLFVVYCSDTDIQKITAVQMKLDFRSFLEMQFFCQYFFEFCLKLKSIRENFLRFKIDSVFRPKYDIKRMS